MPSGPRHRLFAAATQPACALLLSMSLREALMGIPIAIITATAPDLDNTRSSKKTDKHVKDEVLGGGGPLGHRQLSHWWGVPVVLAVLAHQADLGQVAWLVYAALWGYLSHILLDLPFGEEGMGTREGVPVFLWYGRVGGWFYSDRLAADLLIWPACVLIVWATFGAPGHAEMVAWLHPYLEKLPAMT